MMETSQIILIAFILSLVLYNYSGLYVSRKYDAKIPFWSTILKGHDPTFYLVYGSYLALVIGAALAIITERFQLPLTIAGFGVILVSIIINLLARQELARNWSPLAGTSVEQSLIKSGIYAHIRHPIYTSGILLSLGLALITSSLWGLALFILAVIAFVVRINAEEKALLAKFGVEYQEYAQNTGALLPKLH
ncbi:MAG TPA: isoprenylcysteine carboxylmethyltransferase family protein [Anaerolineaceae bacterium]|nr:isoprenylcysteine carboxylmethyltransferase family protein [Anaerolineaceae bacterium]